jgi:hypothetical protein
MPWAYKTEISMTGLGIFFTKPNLPRRKGYTLRHCVKVYHWLQLEEGMESYTSKEYGWYYVPNWF